MTVSHRTVTHRIERACDREAPYGAEAKATAKAQLQLADLNLLRVFVVISELQNLTAAGERLGLTQPAISHALRRLRNHLDDPLFVRTPSGMAPTDAARKLGVPLNQAFGIISQALQQLARFEPSTAGRVFRLSMSDMAQSRFLPPLLGRLAEVAPGIRLEVSTVPVHDLGAAMRNGAIDLALGFIPDLGAGCISQTLFWDEFVCMVRSGHPLRKRAPTQHELAQLQYVVAESSSTGHRVAMRQLEASRFSPSVAARLPHFIVASQIVQQTDLAMLFPRSIAECLNRGRAFRIFPLPFALPRFEVQVHWHERFSADPGLVWLRAQVLHLFHRSEPEEVRSRTAG